MSSKDRQKAWATGLGMVFRSDPRGEPNFIVVKGGA